MKYEEKKKAVLEFLSRPENKGLAYPVSQIGELAGHKKGRARYTWACITCKRMVAEVLLVRDGGGWYYVKE
jgi:hypothetical protein